MGARDLPDDLARAAELVDSILAEFMAPPPRITITEWAERNRVLSGKDSSEPGPYRVARTPYAREPQDALSPMSAIEEIVLMWGAQTSKTTIANNWVGAVIDLQPGSMMIVQPTIDMAKRYSRQRLQTMIEESPSLRRKVRENRSRDDANTTLLKEYDGGYLAIAGANSAAGLRSMPIRDIVFDEVDAYPLDVDGEGDPIALAEARQTTFARRKRLKTSTPTTKGFSRIEAAYLASDQRRYQVPCPHCGHYQVLEWGADKPHGLKWLKTDAGEAIPETAQYVCIGCGGHIAEHHKTAMLAGGQWVAENPSAPARTRGYHLNSLYSPLGWLSWAQLVVEWARARAAQSTGDHSLMRAFVNTRLAETWEEAGDKVAHHELAKRAEEFPLGHVPLRGLLLAQGVDTQPDRLERRVWAFGRGEESWLVDMEVIYGDPNLPEGAEGSPWNRVSEARRTALPHAGGGSMMIEATAIDTGGANTQAVYAYCRSHAHANVLAIKGSSQAGRAPIGKPSQVDINWMGKSIPRGLKLWIVGVDTVKHLIYGRLRSGQPGPGCVHLPKALAAGDEFEQLTAERLVTKYIKGHAKQEWWKPSGKRNEALDCAVYAYAAAVYVGLTRMREGDWLRREQRWAPREPDLFKAAEATAEPARAPLHVAAPAPDQNDTTNLRPPAASTFTRDW